MAKIIFKMGDDSEIKIKNGLIEISGVIDSDIRILQDNGSIIDNIATFNGEIAVFAGGVITMGVSKK